MKLGIPENACQEQFNQSFLVDIKEKKLILALVLKKKKKRPRNFRFLLPENHQDLIKVFEKKIPCLSIGFTIDQFIYNLQGR